MRTFVQKQNQPRKPASSSFARSNTAILGLNHHANPLLQLQRIIGNQAVRRMLQTHVDQAHASPGRPLESGLRQDTEQRFGSDTALIQRKPGDVNEPKNPMSRKEEDKKAELEFHSTVAFNSTASGYSPTGPPTEEGFAAILIRWAVWNTGWKTAPAHVDRLTIYKADRCSGCRDEKDEILTVNVTAPSIVSITQPGEGASEYEGINHMIGMTLRAGHYDVYVDLDVYDEVEEINKDNNTAFMTFYVKPPNKSEPDTEEE